MIYLQILTRVLDDDNYAGGHIVRTQDAHVLFEKEKRAIIVRQQVNVQVIDYVLDIYT